MDVENGEEDSDLVAWRLEELLLVDLGDLHDRAVGGRDDEAGLRRDPPRGIPEEAHREEEEGDWDREGIPRERMDEPEGGAEPDPEQGKKEKLFKAVFSKQQQHDDNVGEDSTNQKIRQ